jgi:hypothetical protein
MFFITLLIIVFLIFGLTVFRGAPYVPAHRRDVEAVLDALELRPGDVIVDLGSGDGVVLLAAAKRGLVAYGYEINPLLCVVAWLRCRHYSKQVKILWRDFWLSDLPADTKAIFVFAAGPFMKKLADKFNRMATQHNQQFHVASYGFKLPGVQSIRTIDGSFIYLYDTAGRQKP